MLVPGLLAAGIGSLIFIGLDNWTGFGTFSLAVPDIPPFGTPTVAEFLWAIAIGIVAAALVTRSSGGSRSRLQPIVERRKLLLTPLVGARRRSAGHLLFDRGDRPGLVAGALLGPGQRSGR